MFEPPPKALPLPVGFLTPEEYITSLLRFSRHPLFQTLCGGVHILDFFTRDPPDDLYTAILPSSWRDYFSTLDIDEILDILMQQDLDALDPHLGAEEEEGNENGNGNGNGNEKKSIPESLKAYIKQVRGHCLVRDFNPRWAKDEEEIEKARKLRKARRKGEVLSEEEEAIRVLTVGMKPKKMHEVENFAHLLQHILSPSESESATSNSTCITHIADIGSGRGYLPRILASPSYGYNVVAIESKAHNITGAIQMDQWVDAREEKRHRKQLKANPTSVSPAPGWWKKGKGKVQYVQKFVNSGNLQDVVILIDDSAEGNSGEKEKPSIQKSPSHSSPSRSILLTSLHSCGDLVHHALHSLLTTPSISGIALIGCCYNLMSEKLTPPTYKPPFNPPNYHLTTSQHLNANPQPSENANPTLPPLRNPHPRLLATSPNQQTPNPHGFPLSHTLTHIFPTTLNITARMMACQAPQNWTRETSQGFFTRHFYRALLQRVFVDAGVVGESGLSMIGGQGGGGDCENGAPLLIGQGEPITLGSLPPQAYTSFPDYVLAALRKIHLPPQLLLQLLSSCGKNIPGLDIQREHSSTEGGKGDDGGAGEEEADTKLGKVLDSYATQFMDKGAYHTLSITWSLMAFSAGVVESLIVVDRWLWLREHMPDFDPVKSFGREGVGKRVEGEVEAEQGEVEDLNGEKKQCGVKWEGHQDGLEIEKCWVEVCFEFQWSPRNLVVVGVRKR